MATMADSQARRTRRSFTDAYKTGAVRLVLDEGKTVAAAARDLGLTESSLRNWVEQARADRTKGKTGLTTEERTELAALRKDNRELRMERDILKKAAAFFARNQASCSLGSTRRRPSSRSRSCVSTCRSRPAAFTRRAVDPNPRARRPTDACASWCVPRSTRAISGMAAPRIHEDLIEQEERVSRKRVIRLMQEDGLEARARKRFTCTTMSDHDQPVAANLLDRCFEAPGPNQRWVGDTTEFVIGSSGKLSLAVVLDLFSRFVVGWAVSAVNDRHVTIKALDMARKRRCPDAGLLHHSDQGCTYASEDYQTILGARGIVCSMSRRGNCYDNAVMESFFSTVKSELADRFDSFGEAKMELFDYLEVFYNQRRRHSTLGQISPAVFERRAAQAA